jgi:hypothetical protein
MSACEDPAAVWAERTAGLREGEGQSSRQVTGKAHNKYCNVIAYQSCSVTTRHCSQNLVVVL